MRNFGVSSFAFSVVVSCSAAIRVIWIIDMALTLKAFIILLLFLLAYMVFSYDMELRFLESMKK